MKRTISILLTLALVAMAMIGCAAPAAQEAPAVTEAAEAIVEGTVEAAPEEAADGAKPVVGFVTFGLGGDFFQQLADAYVVKMNEAGWEASYADGKFDPTAQIEACENYIAMGVDVLVLWAVAPEAMGAVIDQAIAADIKVVAFVAQTEKFDVVMLSDNADLADCCAKLAAKWIDATFADAEDHSVLVAVFSCRTADTGVVQADELLKIEQFSQKAKFVIEVACEDETQETGLAKMENLYTTNPEIQVFLSAHSGLGNGINSFFTSLSSPVTDYSNLGIFCINGDNAMAETIKSSVDGNSPLRGMVLTGSVDDTATELMQMVTGIYDGTVESGHVQMAGTTFVDADTVDEYLETGHVTSVSRDDF